MPTMLEQLERYHAAAAGSAAGEAFKSLARAYEFARIAPSYSMLCAQQAGAWARDCQTHTAKAEIPTGAE